MTPDEKRQLYSDELVKRQLKPRVTENAHISFYFEGRRYILFVDQNDYKYFSLIAPDVWSSDNEEDRDMLMHLCNEVSYKVPCVKAVVLERSVDISIELYFAAPDTFRPVLMRLLSSLQYSVYFLLEKIHDLQNAKDPQ